MKRLVWLLLLAFCTALAQVPTVTVQVAIKADASDCCSDQSQGGCAKAAGRGMDHCVVCVTCGPAFNCLVPGEAVLGTRNAPLVAHLGFSIEKGLVRTDPPLLTPPRLVAA